MPDPIVHITGGIPDSGTGNITTLGQTLLDGANVALGATTDAAATGAGTVNAHLRSIATNISTGIPITGTVAVTQSGTWNVGQTGTWNITNITGTVSLPTGAATSALQPTNAGAASTTAGQTGNLELGAVTTGSPTYVTGTSNFLSLTTAGALRVDGSAVTQPVSGTVAVTQGTAANLNATVTGTVAATQSGTWNVTNISGTVSLPTGAATSANQPSNATAASTTTGQTGTVALGAVTTAAPSYTNATSNFLSLTTTGALRVDGSAVTQPISGTVTANQGGNWTARVVGNAGGIVDFVGQNAAQPANSILVGAEFNTTPTTLTTGNASPLQMDSAGNLLVNVKAGGGSGGTSSSFGSAFPSTGTAIGAKDSTGTNMAALNLDASGFLKVNVAAGGASGGTSSSFGSAVPATGTAIGFSDGTNMQLAHVWDGDSGAGTQWVQGVLLKTPASGGAVDIGVSGQPLRVDPTGTTTQPVSGTVNAVQSGTWTVQPGNTANTTAWLVTGTGGTFPITAASLPLPSGASTSANQPTNSALGATTSGQTGNVVLGAVTTAAPSYTTATSNALSLTTTGALRVDGSAVTQPISGTITANQGGSNWTVNVAQINGVTPLMGNGVTGTGSQRVTIASDNTAFSVNAVQSGTWNIGTLTSITNTVNVASPTAPISSMNSASATGGVASAMAAVFDDVTPTGITENNFGYVRMSANRNLYGTIRDAAGNERGANVTAANALVVDASATTQPVSGTVTANQGGTWTVQPGNTANTTPWLTTARIVGNAGATLDVASSQNAAMPTNMLVFGGEYNTTPTAITSGNCSPLQVDTRGRLISVNSLRASKGVQKTSITVATETTVVTAGGAGVFQDVYAIVVTNKSATPVFVDFKDATAGTTRMTLAAPANDTRGFTVTADSAMVQAVAANNWTATVSGAVTSIEITMLFVSNVA